MCGLCVDAEEMDPDSIQKFQSVTDKMDRDKRWNVSKLHWIARKNMGDI